MKRRIHDNEDFRKSSWSKNNPKTCVEVATGEIEVKVRDSKDTDGPVLTFTLDEWVAFTKGVKDGEFDV